MPYDVELAERLRSTLAPETGLVERRMFGGVAFLVGGRLAVCASSEGGLLVRVDPAAGASLVDGQHVRRFTMRGRETDGWLHVDAAAVADDAALRRWSERAVAHARGLPPRR